MTVGRAGSLHPSLQNLSSETMELRVVDAYCCQGSIRQGIDTGWAVQVEHIYLGDRKLSVRTSVLEEKATACTMLCCYADELKEGFYPYVEQVIPPLPMLHNFPSLWPYHHNICKPRTFLMHILSAPLNCVVTNDNKHLKRLFGRQCISSQAVQCLSCR